MNILGIDQASGRIRDAQPVFADKRGSASENSVIAHGDAIVVGNTYGYENPLRVPHTPVSYILCRLSRAPPQNR